MMSEDIVDEAYTQQSKCSVYSNLPMMGYILKQTYRQHNEP
jgi:hypothetical protein